MRLPPSFALIQCWQLESSFYFTCNKAMESCQCFGATQLQHSSNTSKNIPSFLAMQQEYMTMQPPSKLHHGYPINMCDQNQDLYQISYAIITMRKNLNTIE